MNGIAINDVGKLLAVLIALVGGIGMAIAGLIIRETAGLTAGVGLATGALGYVFGNGRLAARTDPPVNMLSPVLPEHEYVRLEDLELLNESRKAAARVTRTVAKAKAKAEGR